MRIALVTWASSLSSATATIPDQNAWWVAYLTLSTTCVGKHPKRLIFIIMPTCAQISSAKFISKLLRHVLVLVQHLQGVYSCKIWNLHTADAFVNSLKIVY
jgi:hypothetical protein